VLPHWRKATWALVFPVAFAAAGLASGEGALVEGAAFMTWPFLIIWFLSRPKKGVVGHGTKDHHD